MDQLGRFQCRFEGYSIRDEIRHRHPIELLTSGEAPGQCGVTRAQSRVLNCERSSMHATEWESLWTQACTKFPMSHQTSQSPSGTEGRGMKPAATLKCVRVCERASATSERTHKYCLGNHI